MKVFRFAFFFGLTVAFTFLLNKPFNGVPALGKVLSPHQGFWQNAENEAITAPSEWSLPGLKEPVTIRFDEQLIPHIFAQNNEDLFFAQGFVTAYHRLWQMEFQMLAAAGRVSEIIGSDGLQYDREKRRRGLTYGAQRSLEEWQKDTTSYRMIEAYTKGVNAYISQLSYAEYPLEYKLLDYAPEPWTEFKTSLLLKEMCDQLSRGEADLQNTNALKLWGKTTFDLLYPDLPAILDPVIPKGTPFDFEATPAPRPDIQFPLEFSESIIEAPSEQLGSNSFVVGKEKTADGSVLFANEPDLGLNLPTIWYAAHLNSPDYNVFGVTLPGAPAIILGFNDSIAWGNTNAKRDLVDWYLIHFKNERREEYQYDNKWLKTQQIIEKIRIRNEETFYDTVVYTHYGPVVYDRNFTVNPEKMNLAMRWTAHDPANDIKTFLLLNKAKNYEDFTNAYRHFDGPPQNVSFASAKGDIGIRIAGKFPIKWEEQGKFLLDGRDSRQEWLPWIPFEHQYQILNPAQHFVSSANQHPGDSTYPYYDYDAFFEHYRNRRINDRLRVINDITEKEMMQLQHDNFNYVASESLPMMLDSLWKDSVNFTSRELKIYSTLEAWDYFNEPDREAPTLFELWSRNVFQLVWDEFDQYENLSLRLPKTFQTVHLLRNNPEMAFVDYLETEEKETTGDLYRMAFRLAIEQLDEWTAENGDSYAWYKFKNTTLRHLLRIPAFSVSEIAIGGGPKSVNAANTNWGPSWRMVVKLDSTGTKGWGVYPGSQSGNPGNPTYAHMINDWARGHYHDLLFEPEIAADHEKIIFNLSLTPDDQP